eukprot:Skav214128  [mRNA]  locus=scaffold1185:634083:634337:+ [translate_table: standard]
MIFFSCSGPFFLPFLMPVVTNTAPGRYILEVLLLRVVKTMDSFLPTFLASSPMTFFDARPLYWNLLRPHRFPGSVVMVGKFLRF